MKITDNLWTEIWSKEKYPSIGEVSFHEEMPVCFASCAYSMDEYFKEGMKILDYGCGPGKFCNFMSQRLQNFEYIGIEPKTDYGKERIKEAEEFFRKDKRSKFGFIGDIIEKEAIEEVDVVLLLSIFTHLSIEDTENILKKLSPIIERNGIIVFTSIIRDKYECIGPGAYTSKEAYGVTYNTEEQIKDLSNKLNYNIELKDKWLHVNEWMHYIYKVSKI